MGLESALAKVQQLTVEADAGRAIVEGDSLGRAYPVWHGEGGRGNGEGYSCGRRVYP